MARPTTLFTGQWADLPLTTLAKKAATWGYDGLELACWGDHLDVFKGATDKKYCQKQLDILAKNKLKFFAVSNHLAGQLVCDPNNDSALRHLRSKILPRETRRPSGAWAVQAMKDTAVARQRTSGSRLSTGSRAPGSGTSSTAFRR